MGGFDEYKRWLIKEIGFGGLLDMPMLQKLNLRFSSWIMSKVDVKSREIRINAHKVLKFWAEDLHKVFGLPCGHREVMGRDGTITQASIEFIQASLGMDKSGLHSLRAAEEFLKRDINEDSSKLEKECFQIAFVIFVMGHLLAPTTKHDYCQIDFWGALANTENIAQFNWCEYVLQVLLEAVTKLKKDVMNKNSTINLFGCHIFFQIFLLDNIDLGMFTTKHDVLPRFCGFDQVTLRRMITMAADLGKSPTSYAAAPLRHATDVCYARSNFVGLDETRTATPLGGWRTSDVPPPNTTDTPGPLGGAGH